MNVLEVKDLSFSYSDTEVFENISFSLQKGDFMGIIGSNGTGKSTLIKLILGLLPYKHGEIYLFGEKNFHAYSKIGYVSQKSNSFNSSFPTTVYEVVSANLWKGIFHRDKDAGKKVMKALEEVGMSEYRNRLIGRLSGGQQQRVFIARVLVSEPELIFLDEPTVGVDAESVDVITDIITGLNRRGITIVMTNHDTPSLINVSNRLLVLKGNFGAEFYDKNRLTVHEIQSLCSGKDGH